MYKRKDAPLTVEDIRFTTKGHALYAIAPQWPEGEVTVKSLGSQPTVRADMISEVSMLGSPGTLPWSQDESGLRVKTPGAKPCQHAYTFKIALKGPAGGVK